MTDNEDKPQDDDKITRRDLLDKVGTRERLDDTFFDRMWTMRRGEVQHAPQHAATAFSPMRNEAFPLYGDKTFHIREIGMRVWAQGPGAKALVDAIDGLAYVKPIVGDKFYGHLAFNRVRNPAALPLDDGFTESSAYLFLHVPTIELYVPARCAFRVEVSLQDPILEAFEVLRANHGSSQADIIVRGMCTRDLF